MELHQLMGVHTRHDKWIDEVLCEVDSTAHDAVEGFNDNWIPDCANPQAGPPAKKPLVIIESPYEGNVEANLQYARKCVADSLARGECPIASHLLYTQNGILDDNKPEERDLGIEAGLAWYRVADLCVVYADLGMSKGMSAGVERAALMGVRVVVRFLEQEASVRRVAA